jgi:general secretion pathway protein D
VFPCLLAATFLLGFASQSHADGNGVPGGIAGIAAAEARKRQGQVEAAQTLFTAGSKAYADQSYAEAMDYFKAAFETVPDVPAVAEQRQIFFKRYQSASFRYAEILAAEAKWPECEKMLADVVALAESRKVPAAEIDPELRKMLKELQARDERYNLAMTPQHLRDVNQVEAKLILARGFLELGDYDRAERSYNEVLNVDPFSTAARRGLEETERFRMNYYDAAYDHTRSKKLAQVTAAWESPVPPLLGGEAVALNADGVVMGGNVALDRKLEEIIIPRLEFSDARLAEVVEFLGMKAQELDTSETDPTKRGVN